MEVSSCEAGQLITVKNRGVCGMFKCSPCGLVCLWYVQMFSLWCVMSVKGLQLFRERLSIKTYAPIPNSFIGNASYC